MKPKFVKIVPFSPITQRFVDIIRLILQKIQLRKFLLLRADYLNCWCGYPITVFFSKHWLKTENNYLYARFEQSNV